MSTETLAAPATPPAPLSTTELGEHVRALRMQVARAFIGQTEVFEQVLLALLASGHVLIEGVPGLGKTLLVRALAASVGCSFGRVQFTPDLMPADVTGHAIYDPKTEAFKIRRGPVFANLLLADEINRAPAKTQAALLESMQEGQVTIEGRRFPLPAPFMVVATQNPIEQEGTYPLPEAQLDRFLIKVTIGYPTLDDERRMVAGVVNGKVASDLDVAQVQPVLSQAELVALQQGVAAIRMDAAVTDYAVRIVRSTREWPGVIGGAGPRGGLALARLARAQAAVDGRDFVTPDDVRTVALPALRHRLLLAPEALLERQRPDDVLKALLHKVPAPRQ
ncbi:AAA family ATPase [Rhodanobacter denitrificans]|uniref:MoxR-like ATPase n=1 Tax=Rhodanobacter denitrificans TaxID=666685 RepID=I4WJ64_9GAMM|nr:MoxR family ATPase [Rhodanobacter denitrificans]AGG90286.1 MoxR-like ATPase [Rhodanobacter denitrificans]EIL99505.1 ATPase [Rhodanobacter denitrificans]UJM85673.1 AAA family ATPase [Rhodanobacter denitrificans]UJM91302.1 AAA family ATPase [Rhodanobacter denitrificans]